MYGTLQLVAISGEEALHRCYETLYSDSVCSVGCTRMCVFEKENGIMLQIDLFPPITMSHLSERTVASSFASSRLYSRLFAIDISAHRYQ